MFKGMNGARVTLVATCVVVAGLGVWFGVAKWDQANKAATVASALAAVAAVGVAVWTALRASSGPTGLRHTIRATGTGKATATGPGSSAISGVHGTAGNEGPVRARNTGDAQADGGGSAVSGVDLG
jgi:cytosine/uracil/thiamine/allantoin permease